MTDGGGATHIGVPITPMVERVKKWLSEGKDVRIFTARVWFDPERPDTLAEAQETAWHIDRWCLAHIGQHLPITFAKDYHMIELWDDRAVQVIPNTGMRADGAEAPFLDALKPFIGKPNSEETRQAICAVLLGEAA